MCEFFKDHIFLGAVAAVAQIRLDKSRNRRIFRLTLQAPLAALHFARRHTKDAPHVRR